jgi:hypothetical protein
MGARRHLGGLGDLALEERVGRQVAVRKVEPHLAGDGRRLVVVAREAEEVLGGNRAPCGAMSADAVP